MGAPDSYAIQLPITLRRIQTGKSYVIYGSSRNSGNINLSAILTNTQSSGIISGAQSEKSGYSVSGVGDLIEMVMMI